MTQNLCVDFQLCRGIGASNLLIVQGSTVLQNILGIYHREGLFFICYDKPAYVPLAYVRKNVESVMSYVEIVLKLYFLDVKIFFTPFIRLKPFLKKMLILHFSIG